ncbi:MAG: hypothetical protein ABJN26_13260 [Stappiaceae bacterium]
MTFFQSGALFGVIVFSCLCTAVFIAKGSPPIYVKADGTGDSAIRTLRFDGFLMTLAMLATAYNPTPMYLGAFGIYGVWAIWRVRSQLKRETDGPLPWLFFPPVAGVLRLVCARWPMFVFDLWILGSGAVVIAMIAYGPYQ